MSKIYKNKRELIDDVIKPSDTVLDIGFLGQGVTEADENWPHKLLRNKAKDVYGLDLNIGAAYLGNDHYQEGSAENFQFGIKFDVIFAGDLIEHLSNPGLFLSSCLNNLKEGGALIITTPNCFNLFNLAGKMTNREPAVNKDHTCYFNEKTLIALLKKNSFEPTQISFVYSLEMKFKESLRKKFLNLIYYVLSKFTPKFSETLVVIAKKNE